MNNSKNIQIFKFICVILIPFMNIHENYQFYIYEKYLKKLNSNNRRNCGIFPIFSGSLLGNPQCLQSTHTQKKSTQKYIECLSSWQF